jgi:cell division protein FtsN
VTKQNKKRTPKEPGGGGFLRGKAGWYVTLFVVSCWMFLIGVFVGRGTMPLKFKIDPVKIELEQFQKAEEQQDLERIKKAAEAAKAPSDLAFYEELKKETPRPAAVEKTQTQTERKPVPKKAGSTVVRKKVQKPETASSTDKKPAAAEKPLTVQAASIKDLKDAETLVADLKQKGFDAYKTIGIIPEKGIWFRVRVGRFGSQDEAADTIKRLEKEGFDPLLIRVQP